MEAVKDHKDMLNLQDYYERVRDAIVEHSEWRVGQTYFNVLHEMASEIANEVRSTTADPFHNDRKIPSFLNWVIGHDGTWIR